MEHRHFHGIFRPDLNDRDHNFIHNYVMPQQAHHGYAISEPNRVPLPVDNRLIDQRPMCPNWNYSTASNWHPYAHQSIGMQHHQPAVASSYHPYPPLPVGGYFPTFPRSSSYLFSNNDPRSFHRNGPRYDDLRIDGRGSYKRKSPAIPFVEQSGSASRYDGAGSSSSTHVYPNFVQEKPFFDYTRQWEYHAMQTYNHVSENRPVVDEGVTRNVRRRYAFDVAPDVNVSGSYVQFTRPVSQRPVSHPYGCSIPVESNGVNSDWMHIHMPPAAPGVMQFRDFGNSSQGSNVFLCGGAASNLSSETRVSQNYFDGGRNPFCHQNLDLTRRTQEVHSYSQQYPQSDRTTHYASDVGPTHDTMQIVSENYSSTRHPRPYHREGRNLGPRILRDRSRFLPGDSSVPDRHISEGFNDLDQSAMQVLHNVFDQHNDMRLDVDNMTYEELLSLGERIGSVCTGLSNDGMSKCLIEVVHCSSSKQVQEEEMCAICLEEYKNMDSIGTLSGCGHGYHSLCIKTWISMKNSCPICKAPALAVDNMNDKENLC